jgi:hypothetical protein
MRGFLDKPMAVHAGNIVPFSYRDEYFHKCSLTKDSFRSCEARVKKFSSSGTDAIIVCTEKLKIQINHSIAPFRTESPRMYLLLMKH